MNEFIATFHIDWKLMIAQIINFALVFVVFYLLAAKPLSKLMKDRTQEIQTGLTNAKDNAVLLEKTQKEYDEIIRKARNEANTVFQTGKKEAEAKKTAMIEEAKIEVASIIENGKKSLQAEKIKAVEEAKKDIAILSLKAAEKVLSIKKDLNSL
ncbi:MAG: F0F1 ATP synthase subunit B [Candidatus Paceibacterota bacterium]|jgi:F-type H+-transporting ATPase subunit b